MVASRLSVLRSSCLLAFSLLALPAKIVPRALTMEKRKGKLCLKAAIAALSLLLTPMAQAAETAQSWRERIAEDRTQFLKNVIERVTIHSDHVAIRLRAPALVSEILGGSPTLV
jgi:hypothetical protein